MPAKTDNKEIIKTIYRTTYQDEEYYFSDILKNAIKNNCRDDSEVDVIARSKETRIWNSLKRQQTDDMTNGIVPLFTIISDNDRTVKWIGDCSNVGANREVFVNRPKLYTMVDSFNDREYEVFACFVCKCLGADKITLTAPGNEGGVDFYARIPFSKKAHHFFGIKGPIRVVGQCKKFNKKDNVGNMKEFIQTLDFVHNNSFRAGETMPNWFKLEKGIIIGWHISDLGHQSGALDIAKNFGVIVSDTKELIDIICKANVIDNKSNVVKTIQDEYMNELLYCDI